MHETATDAQQLMAAIKPLIAKAEAIAAEAREAIPLDVCADAEDPAPSKLVESS